jgi:hypothetical protein
LADFAELYGMTPAGFLRYLRTTLGADPVLG